MKINNDIKDLTVIEKDSSEEEIVKILHEFCIDINDEYEITTIKHYRHDILLMLNANAQCSEFYSFVKNILDLLENDYIASNGKPINIDNAINHLIDKLLFWHITRRKTNKISDIDNYPISHFYLNREKVFSIDFIEKSSKAGKEHISLYPIHTIQQNDIDMWLASHQIRSKCIITPGLSYIKLLISKFELNSKKIKINLKHRFKIDPFEVRDEQDVGEYNSEDEHILSGPPLQKIHYCELDFKLIARGNFEISEHYSNNDKTLNTLCDFAMTGFGLIDLESNVSLENNQGDFVKLFSEKTHAYLELDQSDLCSLLNVIYIADFQRLTGIINSKPELVNTPLIKQSVRSGAIEIITYPFIEAILSNQMDMVKILLGEGKASINAVTSAGITPLYATMLMGHKTLSYNLIAKGAKLTNEYKHSVLDNIPVRELFSTYHFQKHILTLYDAIEKQDIDFIKKYLIDEGRSGNLPFILPEEETHLEIIYYPIIAAIRTGNLEIIKLLVEEGGADVNVSNFFDHLEDSNSKNTGQALHEAVNLRYDDIPRNQVVSIIDYLIDRGANVNAIVGFGWIPLTSAVTQTIIEGKNNIYDFSIIDLLLERGADINFEVPFHMLSDISQGTALGEAICANDITVVKYLLDKGANPNAKDPSLSALKVASFGDQLDNPISDEIIKLLKERGAK